MRRVPVPTGVFDDAPCALHAEAKKDFLGDDLGRQAGLGVLEHAVREDAIADHDLLAGDFARYALNVGALGPVDHGEVVRCGRGRFCPPYGRDPVICKSCAKTS